MENRNQPLVERFGGKSCLQNENGTAPVARSQHCVGSAPNQAESQCTMKPSNWSTVPGAPDEAFVSACKADARKRSRINDEVLLRIISAAPTGPKRPSFQSITENTLPYLKLAQKGQLNFVEVSTKR